MSAEANALWIVAKEGCWAGGEWLHPTFYTELDEDEARKQAKHAKAVLVRLPIMEDYRQYQEPDPEGER